MPHIPSSKQPLDNPQSAGQWLALTDFCNNKHWAQPWQIQSFQDFIIGKTDSIELSPRQLVYIGNAISRFSKHPKNRPFCNTIIDVIYDKWRDAVEQAAIGDFHNRHRLENTDGHNRDDTRYQALHLQQCKPLADMLHACVSTIIHGHAQIVAPRFVGYNTIPEIVAQGFNIFQSCLFRHNKTTGLSFADFVSLRLHYDLAEEVFKSQPEKEPVVSLDAIKPTSGRKERDWHTRIVDRKTDAKAIKRSELAEDIRDIAKRILSARDFDIFSAYYPETGTATAREVAKQFGLSPAGIGQIIKAAEKTIAHELAQEQHPMMRTPPDKPERSR